MKRNIKTIRYKMFVSYTIIIVAMALGILLIICLFIFSTLRDNTYSSLESIMESQMNNIDKEIEGMDSLALNILFSPVTREVFVKSPKKEQEEERWSEEISNMMSAFANPSFSVPQIMLYDFEGHAVGTDSNHIRTIDITNSPWYEKVLDKDGKKYISNPYSGIDDTFSLNKFTSSELISLCRTVFDTYRNEKGIVEVKQYYSKIFQELDEFMMRDMYVSVVVINEEGEQIYPLKISDTRKQFDMDDMKNMNYGEEKLFVGNKDGYVMGYKRSDVTGWTLCMLWDHNKVMEKVYWYTGIFSFSVLLIMIVALLNGYFVSKQISRPIEMLRQRIKKLDVNNSLPEAEDESGLSEIEAVNNTLDQVSIKLTRTVNDMLQFQQQELQAKMLALQSQMNPHFLYNSLSVICALAEESRTDQIIYTCKNISNMLRYISSGKSHIVTVKEEIEYTRQYLECMKIRYGIYLQYSIDVPEAVLKQPLTKLSIQPLVENAVKSCTQCEDPWIICVNGKIEDEKWKVSIQDNGRGFSKEERENFYKKIRNIENDRTIPGLELGGMGMVNVYMRLKFQYDKDMVFDISDQEQQGANITIGGKIMQ